MANFEQLVNNYSSTLGSSINNSVTTLTVASATGLPTDKNFRIKIGDEIMLVTGVSGTTLTVVRGAESTTAASHTSGDKVRAIVTAGGLKQLLVDNIPCYGDQYQIGKFQDNTDSDIELGDFTQINWNSAQGDADAEMSGGVIKMELPCHDIGGPNLQGLALSTPATPYAAILRFRYPTDVDWLSANFQAIIMAGFRASATGRSQYITLRDATLAVWGYNDETSYVGSYRTIQNWLTNCDDLCVKLEHDGTNINYYWSGDGGVHFNKVYTEPATGLGNFFNGETINQIAWVGNARHDPDYYSGLGETPNWNYYLTHWSWE